MSWVLQAGKVAYDASDFDNDAARQEKATSGEELIRLTNWTSGNTSRPLIQAGSKIVVNNTLFYTDSDTALIDDPGGLIDGEVFIRFEKSGSDPAFTLIAYLTNDDPRSAATFDAAKGGWYEPATNNKYIDIIMEVSGTLTSFDLKGNQDIDNGNKEWLDGSSSIEGISNLKSKLLSGTYTGASISLLHGIADSSKIRGIAPANHGPFSVSSGFTVTSTSITFGFSNSIGPVQNFYCVIFYET